MYSFLAIGLKRFNHKRLQPRHVDNGLKICRKDEASSFLLRFLGSFDTLLLSYCPKCLIYIHKGMRKSEPVSFVFNPSPIVGQSLQWWCAYGISILLMSQATLKGLDKDQGSRTIPVRKPVPKNVSACLSANRQPRN